jgi:hypothetical protein
MIAETLKHRFSTWRSRVLSPFLLVCGCAAGHSFNTRQRLHCGLRTSRCPTNCDLPARLGHVRLTPDSRSNGGHSVRNDEVFTLTLRGGRISRRLNQVASGIKL